MASPFGFELPVIMIKYLVYFVMESCIALATVVKVISSADKDCTPSGYSVEI